MQVIFIIIINNLVPLCSIVSDAMKMLFLFVLNHKTQNR